MSRLRDVVALIPWALLGLGLVGVIALPIWFALRP